MNAIFFWILSTLIGIIGEREEAGKIPRVNCVNITRYIPLWDLCEDDMKTTGSILTGILFQSILISCALTETDKKLLFDTDIGRTADGHLHLR